MGSNHRIVVYLGSWSNYRQDNGKFVIEDIDPTLSTHLIYAFVGLNPDATIKIIDSWLDIDLKAYERFNKLKLKNPKLKTMLAIGGWNEGSTTYSQVARDGGLRAAFAKNAAAFLLKYKFDGLDMDWEYPNQRGGIPEDKANFILLLRELRGEFDKHKLLLSAAVQATKAGINRSYIVPEMAKYLDFLNLMTYDLHGSWDGATGENSPLYPSKIDVTDVQKELNADACVKAWIDAGFPPGKINMGIPGYGRSFTLANPNNNGLGAQSYGGGTPGPYTKEAGMLGYNEICELVPKEGWTTVWNEDQKVPYAYKGNQWVGYDNPRSIKIKTEYVREKNLGGVMLWSVETDDFRGISGLRYPLLRAINQGL